MIKSIPRYPPRSSIPTRYPYLIYLKVMAFCTHHSSIISSPHHLRSRYPIGSEFSISGLFHYHHCYVVISHSLLNSCLHKLSQFVFSCLRHLCNQHKTILTQISYYLSYPVIVQTKWISRLLAHIPQRPKYSITK